MSLLSEVPKPAPTRHVVFSHGLEGAPWGTKINSLAEIARAEGYSAESVDYRGVDSPTERMSLLMNFCKELQGDLVLVGSSLGGYVSLGCASNLHARGVFLMAPAIYVDGLPPLKGPPLDCPVTLIHGLHDDVVPYEHSIRFAKAVGAPVHLLDDDHRLHANIRLLRYLFEYFLISLDMPVARWSPDRKDADGL
jgi:pimeloyl-ACP methyl ester carboxylesterase